MISSNEKRIYKNTLALALRTFLSIPIGFFSVRIALNLLGAADYGMADVLGGLTALAVSVSGCVGGAARRFLCFDLGDINEARTRNLFSMLILIFWVTSTFLIIALEGFGYWMITTQIQMPVENIPMALLFYQTVLIGFWAQCIGSAYTALLTAYEEISVIAWVAIGESLLHLGLVAALAFVSTKSLLVPYGIVNMVSCVVAAVAYWQIARFKCGNVSRFHWNWDGGLFNHIFNFTFWGLCAVISGSIYGMINGVLLNNYFTSVLNAAKNVAGIVTSKISTFGYSLFVASNPQLIKLYAQGEIEKLEMLFTRITKLSFFILFSIGLPLFTNLEYILELWLKNPPPYCAEFATIGFITALVDITCNPGNILMDATGKIRGYQIFRAAIPWFFMALIYIGLKRGMGPLWIPLVALFAAAIGNIIRFSFIKHFIPKFRILRFAFEMLRRIGSVVVVGCFVMFTFRVLGFNRTWSLVLVNSVLAESLLGVIVWCLGLTVEERIDLKTFVRNTISKFYP